MSDKRQFDIYRLRDVNTLETIRSGPDRDWGPAQSPRDFESRMVRECKDRVDRKLFPNGDPKFDSIVEPFNPSGPQVWEVTVFATYAAGCQQAQEVAKKLKAGGVTTLETKTTILRATME